MYWYNVKVLEIFVLWSFFQSFAWQRPYLLLNNSINEFLLNCHIDPFFKAKDIFSFAASKTNENPAEILSSLPPEP